MAAAQGQDSSECNAQENRAELSQLLSVPSAAQSTVCRTYTTAHLLPYFLRRISSGEREKAEMRGFKSHDPKMKTVTGRPEAEREL